MVSLRKLTYVTNTRFPTEKAHGYQICKMCEAFGQLGIEVSLVCPKRYQEDPALRGENIFNYYRVARLFDVRIVSNVDVTRVDRFLPDIPVQVLGFLHSWIWGFYVAGKVKQRPADLYYTRDIGVAYALLRLRLPTMYEAHGVPRHAQRWVLQQILNNRFLKGVGVLTQFIKNDLMEMGLSEDRVVLLPSGVDLSLFRNLPDRQSCRLRLDLPQDKEIIGYIGRFTTMGMEKGIFELIKSLRYLSGELRQSVLLLCVGGPMDAVPTYREIAASYGVPQERIKFVDRVSNVDVPLWIRACDVVTLPWPWTQFSAYFTSPMKLFEYMAAGVAIVSSRLPSLEQILSDGDNALLVRPGSPKCLATAIERILRSPSLAHRLVSRGLEDVGQYTWKKRASSVIDFWKTTQS